MKYFAAISLLLLPMTALAQDATGTQAGAEAQNTVNVVAITGPQGPSDANVTYDGHTWTTPNVGGSYFAGANPCLVGQGGGAAGGPIGFSLTLGKSDKGCTRRSDAAAWHALGFDGIAVARMCQDQGNADAFFSATGLACPGSDLKRYKNADGSPANVAFIPNKGLPQN